MSLAVSCIRGQRQSNCSGVSETLIFALFNLSALLCFNACDIARRFIDGRHGRIHKLLFSRELAYYATLRTYLAQPLKKQREQRSKLTEERYSRKTACPWILYNHVAYAHAPAKKCVRAIKPAARARARSTARCWFSRHTQQFRKIATLLFMFSLFKPVGATHWPPRSLQCAWANRHIAGHARRWLITRGGAALNFARSSKGEVHHHACVHSALLICTHTSPLARSHISYSC